MVFYPGHDLYFGGSDFIIAMFFLAVTAAKQAQAAQITQGMEILE